MTGSQLAVICSVPLRDVVEGKRALEGVAGTEEQVLRELPPDQLEADGEAFGPGAVVHRADVAVRGRADAVADAVVAGEVRGRLGGSDQVVAGESELDRARQAALAELGAEPAGEIEGAGDLLADAGFDSL